METHNGQNNHHNNSEKPESTETEYLNQLEGELGEFYKQNKNKITRFVNFIEHFDCLVREVTSLTDWINKEYYMSIKNDPNGGNVSGDLSSIINFLEPDNYNIKKLTILVTNLKDSTDYEEFITKIDPNKKEIIKDCINQLNLQLTEIGLNKYKIAQINF